LNCRGYYEPDSVRAYAAVNRARVVCGGRDAVLKAASFMRSAVGRAAILNCRGYEPDSVRAYAAVNRARCALGRDAVLKAAPCEPDSVAVRAPFMRSAVGRGAILKCRGYEPDSVRAYAVVKRLLEFGVAASLLRVVCGG
jgi:hypothetical protein